MAAFEFEAERERRRKRGSMNSACAKKSTCGEVSSLVVAPTRVASALEEEGERSYLEGSERVPRRFLAGS